MKDEDKLLEIFQKCEYFFKQALDEAIKHQRISLSQEAAKYLLDILILGLRLDPFKEMPGVGGKYLEALEQNRTSDFKKIGDASLLAAGIWWRSLLRKLVDVDYYIKIGSMSYHRVGEAGPQNLSDLFEELADNFKNLVNILAEAAQSVSAPNLSNEDILRMYEVWIKTHNPFLAEKLKELKIIVAPVTTTKH